LPVIEELVIDRTFVTDEAVKWLCGMKSLKVLSIEGTRLSKGGIEKVKASLPGTFIYGAAP
jgi:hypothetical protein